MLTGVIFILAWTLFDNASSARYYASLVPAAVTAKFVAIGLGLLQVRLENGGSVFISQFLIPINF